ncbi:MAG TPA: PKD domain-containing protein [Thermoanaerobaculaceae bacterium]|nr:PKD domain-containing protein [Thermoanaerobaculaceae bacterium]HPS76880.1 PKD domain-containing protein [Thermoanaerobaculaceae bacterium]
MRKLAVFCSALMVAGAVSSQTFVPTLAGNREAGAPGDPDGTGVAVLTIDGARLRYFVWGKGIEAPSAAQVQAGRAGENGAVTISLTGTFTSPASSVFVLAGAVDISSATAAAILQTPSAFYLNLLNPTFPDGAVRGQLLGDGPAASALASTLRGFREAGGGDPDGTGFAALLVDGADAYYYLWVNNITSPTGARIHSGRARQSGGVLVDLQPSFTDGVATGRVTLDAATASTILTHPEDTYFNVPNADFPDGALRGQLAATESLVVFPVLARNAGAGTSNFKSDLRVMSLTDEETPVWFEWFPKSTVGSSGPAKVVRQSVAAGGSAVFDDIISLLFSVNDRGAVRVLSPFPMRAVGRTFNDQRSNGGGTFGQFVEGLGPQQALTAGALLLNSNRPKADALDFRTNLGYFVPGPAPAKVTFNVRKPDGTLVGALSTKTLPGWANDLGLYYQVIPGIPAASQTQANFSVTFTSSVPVYIYSSVVDNKTDDGLNQAALVIPAALVDTPNHPPSGVITSPNGPLATTAGSPVSFSGTATDADSDAVIARWEFGDATSATGLSASHAYAASGTYTARFTVTDIRGLADPTPPQVIVTVGPAANRPPTGTITAPVSPATATIGSPVSFTGTASDPDGDTVTTAWTFGDGSSAPGLVASHAYSVAGSYTVRFTATDGQGLADPAPPQVTVNVNASTFTLSAIQAQIFTPICSSCHPPNRGQDLRDGKSYASIVNVNSVENPALKRVKPGDPDNSYLYQKVASGAMPLGGPPLTDAQLQLIRGWILAGAPNN